MIKIFNKTTGEFIGRISETDLQFLVDQLEEESVRDTDYYIRVETLDEFVKAGASERLMEVLKGGFRNDKAIEIRWENESTTG